MSAMSVAKPTQNQSFETLDVQVRGLETDVRDLKDSVVGLNAKFDQAISSISHEVRTAIAGLTNQFTERQRTPWSPLIAGAGFLVTVLVIFGSQALSPMQADIKSLKEEIVPRVEHNYRTELQNERFARIDRQLEQIQTRRYDELMKSHDRIDSELRDLKRGRANP
jgi:hypothetical protein